MDTAGEFRARRGLIAAFACLTLGACAVATPASVTSLKPASSAVPEVEFIASTDEERSLRAQFKTALSDALASQGVRIADGSAYLAEFAVSQRPAEVGLQDATSDDANAQAPGSDFKPRWYHSCKPSRTSASLVIYSKTSGELFSKAQGQFLACPGDTAQLDDLAQLLAARALQN